MALDLEGDNIVALVDADGAQPVPQDVLFDSPNIRIILAAPPQDESTRSWLNQLYRGCGGSAAQVYVMDNWSPQELIITG
jgi:hypothetical protein